MVLDVLVRLLLLVGIIVVPIMVLMLLIGGGLCLIMRIVIIRGVLSRIFANVVLARACIAKPLFVGQNRKRWSTRAPAIRMMATAMVRCWRSDNFLAGMVKGPETAAWLRWRWASNTAVTTVVAQA